MNIDEQTKTESNTDKAKITIKFLSQFDPNPLLTKPPEKPMLLEYSDESGKVIGFLPKSIVAMLVGAGGVGKTHFLAQLAISVVTGTPFLDTFMTTAHCGEDKKGNVFLGLGENHYDDICRILYKASKKIRSHDQALLTEANKRLAVFSFCGQQATFIEDGKPTPYYRDLKKHLKDTAPEGGWSLIIFDPVSRILGTDSEADNAAATQFIALLEELTIDLPGNPTVLFAHHVNKAAQAQGGNQSQSAARGASGLTDGVRWQMNIAKTESEKAKAPLNVLMMTKSNFTAISQELTLTKDFEGFIEKSEEKPSKKASKAKTPSQCNDRVSEIFYGNN